MELYKNIKRLREEKGLTQDELAQKTGYTNRSSIAKIEKGQVDLTLSKIMVFADALGVPAIELMGWSETPPNIVELKKEEPQPIETLAAHHDNEEWTDAEIAEVEAFKQFVLSKRK